MFVFSLDFELAWGSRDVVPDRGALERQAQRTREVVFEPLVGLLEELGISGTWATVGHLFLPGARRDAQGTLHPALPRPDHAWWRGDWFDGVPDGDERTAPAWYGRSLVDRLIASNQEVGSHSFAHPIFADPGCSRAVADADLARCTALADELGITLRSFVFPRNLVGHTDLVAKHGFTCWRPLPPEWHRQSGVPVPVSRGAHLLSQAAGRAAPTVMPRRDPHGLWELPASTVFLPVGGARRVVSMGARVRRCTATIDAAAHERRMAHVYTHPINLADAPGPMLDGFRRVLTHAARLRDRGRLDIHSMGSLAASLERAAGPPAAGR